MNKFASWWFIHGGSIHRLWKSKSYSTIRDLALELPKQAYDQGYKDALTQPLTEEQKNVLVDKFLSWPLPKTVCPDACTQAGFNYPNRVGTHLLTADEAKQMLDYLFEEKP